MRMRARAHLLPSTRRFFSGGPKRNGVLLLRMRCCFDEYEVYVSRPAGGRFRTDNVVVVRRQGLGNVHARVVASMHSTFWTVARLQSMAPHAALLYRARRLARGVPRAVLQRACRSVHRAIRDAAMPLFAAMRHSDSRWHLPLDLRRIVWAALFAFARTGGTFR